LAIFTETSCAAAADAATERLISEVAACCSSIAAETEAATWSISEIWLPIS
jgi:hypothetical protein